MITQKCYIVTCMYVKYVVMLLKHFYLQQDDRSARYRLEIYFAHGIFLVEIPFYFDSILQDSDF